VGEGGVVVRSEQVLRRASVGPDDVAEVLAREQAEVVPGLGRA